MSAVGIPNRCFEVGASTLDFSVGPSTVCPQRSEFSFVFAVIVYRRRDLVRSFLPYADLREREDSVRKALGKQENGNDSE